MKKCQLSLTCDELCAWSDSRSVERGKRYLSRVESPALFPDGALVAEVHGTDDYYTKLALDADGRLRGVCSCPVGFRCKNCVALALASAKRLKAGGDFPEADLATRRWKCAAEALEDFQWWGSSGGVDLLGDKTLAAAGWAAAVGFMCGSSCLRG